jgi:aryl-alcohol dehydrogenase-like predicted oxidoreductase
VTTMKHIDIPAQDCYCCVVITMKQSTSLSDFRTLGRSGLAVSPLALGTMTFGTANWGSGETDSKEIFDAYVDAGGNFVDTANVYSNGNSEVMLGSFIADRGLRDQIVLATKAGFSAGRGPHCGGNGAKHVHAAIQGSLRRLRTDYVDLFWVHVWDSITPAEELLETMGTLVRSGYARYWGISNAPAWYVAQLAALAGVQGKARPIALQSFYSLVNRNIEDEHTPMANEFGLGIVPWSPLAFGLLTGKYDRAALQAAAPRAAGLPSAAVPKDLSQSHRRLDGDNPFGDTLFTDRNWNIVETLSVVAAETGYSPAQIALAWIADRPGVTSTLLGVSLIQQLTDNLQSLRVQLSPEHTAALNASSNDPRMLYGLFTPQMRQTIVFGGSSVTP